MISRLVFIIQINDVLLTIIAGNSNFKFLHIIDMNNPSAPQVLMSHEFTNVVDGHITAVEACTDTIAVTLAQIVPTNEGHVELFTPYNRADRVFTRIGRITGI